MDLSELNQRFEAVKQKKNRFEQTISRLEGKLEVAQQTLQDIEEECRKRGWNPIRLRKC